MNASTPNEQRSDTSGGPSQNSEPPSGNSPGRGKLAAFGAWFKARQGELALFGLAFSIAVLLLWPHTIITVGPGHVGVLYRRFWGGTVADRIFPEGTHFILPWNTLFIFDARIHEEMHTFSVLTRNGLLLDLDVSILYRPNRERTPELLMTIGQDYREKVIVPALRAAVRSVAAKHEKSDFYSAGSNAIQDAVHVSIVEAVGRKPLMVDNLFIRAVRLPEEVNRAINEKFIAQQEVERQAFKVQEASQRYKISLIDAEAVRMTQEIINANMTEDFLRWKGIEATRALASSPNSKFVIAGGKDGLPIILNPEPSPARPPEGAGEPPEAKAPPEAKTPPKPEQADTRNAATGPEDFMRRIDLKALDNKVNALLQGVLPEENAPPAQPPNGQED